jgi:hypothetical protein
MKYYYLKGKEIHETNNILKWGKEFEKIENRRVAKATFTDTDVSTVFIGIDHRFLFEPAGAPLLFETMIFGSIADNYCDRYETWEQATKGHIIACKIVVNYWQKDNINSFVWEFFKVVFIAIALLIFGLFLVVIL